MMYVFAYPGSGAADDWLQDCGGLEIMMGAGCLKVISAEAAKGKIIKWKTGKNGETGFVDAVESSLYGPDIRIKIEIILGEMIIGDPEYPKHMGVSEYNVQQNYCFLHAGDITVTHIGGPELKYSIVPGSWADDKWGKVRFTYR